MKKIIITAGEKFTDIDILACAIAYSELLNYEEKSNEVVLATFNNSITEEIKKWSYTHLSQPSTSDCVYVIVDISDPEHLAKFVDQKKIIEFYDHHFGFENYWKEKVEGKVIIEPVGSCATLIWEEFKNRKQHKKISRVSANLLTASIISNTLNFKASVTHQRDINSYEELKHFSDLPKNWISKYFNDQEKSLFQNPKESIKNDTHVEKFPDSPDKLIIGQIELWDSRSFINEYKDEIKQALLSFGTKDWFLTSPSISEGKNYIYTESQRVKEVLSEKLNMKFNDGVGELPKLLLRKEIKKILYDY